MNEREMFELARQTAYNSYSLYSNFMTGAALVTKSGKIYTGCNLENQTLQSICAEKVAIAKAISEGERDFKAIFVVGKQKDEKGFREITPCGYCRQFFLEFCKPDFEIYSYNEEKDEVIKYTLQELFPHAFTL